MLRVVAGDMEALGVLFERYRQPLFGFLHRLLHDDAWAEDLTLDAFLRVYDRRRTYQAGRKFSTWLFTIAHNLGADRLRRLSRCELPAAASALDTLRDGGATPEELCARGALTDAVRAAVSALPTDQRVVILLREYEGFSYREIAEVVGASEEAVRVRAHRARQALRHTLGPFVEEEWRDAVTFSAGQT